MNLRVLVNPKEAEGHPFELFFVGFVYATLSVFLSVWLFPAYSSIILVAMTVAAATPIFHYVISFEAEKDTLLHSERSLLSEHRKAILIFTMLFVGFVVGFTLAFFLLPEKTAASVFDAQTKTILAVNSPIGAFAMKEFITNVLANNLRVLLFTAGLSLLFGTGGILILAWNASVMSVAIGSVIKQKLLMGGSYVGAVTASVTQYFAHGIPEVIAYLIAGIAGGILYHAVVRKVWSKQLILDVCALLALATVFLVIAAAIEAYVTPFVT